MKAITSKIPTTKTDLLLKSIELELKAILEEDIRKIGLSKDNGIKNAAFLQLIAA